MMLKILQGTTVALVGLILLAGLGIVFFKPDAIAAYVQYVPVATGILIPEIAAAFLGKPLKEFVAIQREKAANNTVNTENLKLEVYQGLDKAIRDGRAIIPKEQ